MPTPPPSHLSAVSLLYHQSSRQAGSILLGVLPSAVDSNLYPVAFHMNHTGAGEGGHITVESKARPGKSSGREPAVPVGVCVKPM